MTERALAARPRGRADRRAWRRAAPRGGPRRRGGAGPRLRRPVLAADRAADPRMRRLRRAAALDHDVEEIRERAPKALVLSGGPASVYEEGAPPFPTELLDLEIPLLGICYGMQAMVLALGGRVESAEAGEFGRTDLVLRDGGGRLLGGLPEEQSCWMSHRDAVFEAPEGFAPLASSPSSPVAACEMPDRGLYGIQFHPEVVHTPYGTEILDPLPARHRRLRAAVVAAVGDRRTGGEDPGPGRRGPRDLRPLRRRRLLGRGAARPPGGRRPAHLRLRRPRADADERGRAGGRGLRAVRHPAGPRRSRGALPRQARRGRRPRDQAQDHRRASSSASSRRRRRSSRTPATWSRARSTPT